MDPFIFRLKTGEILAGEIAPIHQTGVMALYTVHNPVLCMPHPMSVKDDVLIQGLNFAPYVPGGDETTSIEISSEVVVAMRSMSPIVAHRYRYFIRELQANYREMTDRFEKEYALFSLLLDVNNGHPVTIIDEPLDTLSDELVLLDIPPETPLESPPEQTKKKRTRKTLLNKPSAHDYEE